MTERDIELAAEAEAYADYNFKGEVYWREAYESRLIDLIRADERERIKAANAPEIERINAYIKSLEDAVLEEREACAKLCEENMFFATGKNHATAIRARGDK